MRVVFDNEVASQIFVPFHEYRRPMQVERLFQGSSELVVEVGSGQGEFLVQQALERPQCRYIGIEMDWGRVRKICQRVARLEERERKNAVDRIRIFHVDAWIFFERMCAPRTLDELVCLFPCPWPKDRHEHHRLFSNEFLRVLNSRLKEGKALTVVTDHLPYAQWIEEQARAADTGFDLKLEETGSRFDTKFERKWRAAGQDVFYRMEFTKARNVDMPLKEDISLKAYYHQKFEPERFVLTDESAGQAVIFKDFLYDPRQKKGVVQVVVSEPHLTQHVFIGIVSTEKGWCVLKMGGQQVVPSDGVARAIELVSRAVEQSGRGGL
jgi:tRNA (guanine-N7-)-methyltransferase